MVNLLLVIQPMISRGLSQADFSLVAYGGFGDGRNAYAHSMAWLDGHLYVGTTRDNLCLIWARNPLRMKCWPVKCDDPPDPRAHRAEIWRYDPRANRWDRVYISPMIYLEGQEVMRDIGYRGMCVFGVNGAKPALYVASWSKSGCRFLRSLDGQTFAEVGKPGLGYPGVVCVRATCSFNGRLYASPAAQAQTAGRGPNETNLPIILVTSDPASSEWTPACEPGFGDLNNHGISEMVAFNGHLFAGTLNPIEGFQVWKTKGEGTPPYSWNRVLKAGAYRGNTNEVVVSLCVFSGALYIGTGVSGGGYNRYRKIGPAACEVIRVYPDNSWELLVGEPRFTPDGVKMPVAGLGQGFNNFFNGYAWRMCEYNGWLYLGTYSWAVFLPYLMMDNGPQEVRKTIGEVGIEKILAEYGGCELWRTHDGATWSPVMMDGFGSQFNYGIRALQATPHGLFVGTANPFGPLVAVRSESDWMYKSNSRGGCEIWLGQSDAEHQRATKPDKRRTRTVQRHIKVSKLFSSFNEVLYQKMTDNYYGHSGFHHMGYWQHGPLSAQQACEALVEKLVSFLPVRGGAILDVTSGTGATTRQLVRYCPSSIVVGIFDASIKPSGCRNDVSDLNFFCVEPTQMGFVDNSFDIAICVEGVHRFDSHLRFLREVFRVLKPGGGLVMSDILYTQRGVILNFGRNRRTYVKDLESYRNLFLRTGFEGVNVIDATQECAVAYGADITRRFTEFYQAGEISLRTFNFVMRIVLGRLNYLKYYAVVSARKPASG